MLIRFNVRNFLSFGSREDGSPEEFSMLAGKVRQKQSHIFDDGKLKLLKLAAVYGANASGKSNLVKAIDFMKTTVVQGKLPGMAFENKYCRTEPENRNHASYFEVEILLDGKYYAYGFEAVLSRREFVSEWLVELRANGEDKVLFSRDIRKETFEIGGWKKGSKVSNRLEMYAEDICSDSSALFLSVMNQQKGGFYKDSPDAVIFRSVFSWMNESFVVASPNQPMSYSYMLGANHLNEAVNFLLSFGTGIFELKKIDVPLERISVIPKEILEDVFQSIEKSIEEKSKKNKSIEGASREVSIVIRGPKELFFITLNDTSEDVVHVQTMEFLHEGGNILFELDEESDGTARLLDLLEILIAGEGRTFVIDELDRCLHPNLTYKFIQCYLKAAAKRNIQLIVTTHESRLMDFDLLRRDEIWFVDKNHRGESKVYSLEEFNTRFDRKIDKAYLEGQYGGVPVFDTVFPVDREDSEDGEGGHESE